MNNDPIDTTQWLPEVLPTKQRFAKGDVDIIHSNRGGIEIRTRNFSDRLRWYMNNGFITPVQLRAGKKFYILWFFGGMRSQYAISKYNNMPSKAFEPGTFEEMQQEYVQAKKSIKGNKSKKIVFNVCCIGDAAGKGGMDYLRSALDDLIKHFGYEEK